MKNCVLFRKGNTSIFDGVECETVKVAIDDIEDYLAKGWSLTTDFSAKPVKSSKRAAKDAE
jgi:hypothetical protein